MIDSNLWLCITARDVMIYVLLWWCSSGGGGGALPPSIHVKEYKYNASRGQNSELPKSK